MNAHANKIAIEICKALGMPARFAAEKEVESPTLAASTADYMRGLSDAALNKMCGNRKASAKARNAATKEWARRKGLLPENSKGYPMGI